MNSDMTQTCECGNDTYHIELEFRTGSNVRTWAECAECGRPTKTFGDGPLMQRLWEGGHE